MLCSMQHETLYYVHDPMCSWCWGFQPTWRKIKAELPDGVSVEYLLGGLARDSEEPMLETMRGYLQCVPINNPHQGRLTKKRAH